MLKEWLTPPYSNFHEVSRSPFIRPGTWLRSRPDLLFLKCFFLVIASSASMWQVTLDRTLATISGCRLTSDSLNGSACKPLQKAAMIILSSQSITQMTTPIEPRKVLIQWFPWVLANIKKISRGGRRFLVARKLCNEEAQEIVKMGNGIVQ